MLHVPSTDGVIATPQSPLAGAEPARVRLAALGRYWILLLISLGAGLSIAALIVMTTQPVFQASTRVLFDPTRADAQRSTDPQSLQYSIDAAQIESQIQLLRSDQVRRAVMDAHGLAEDPELTTPSLSILGLAKSAWLTFVDGPTGTADHQSPPDARYGLAMSEFDRRLDIRRLGQSYVLQVTYQSRDPDKAARLANAVTAAYIALQLAPRIDVARRTGQFERTIRELNADSERVSEAVRTGRLDVNAFPAADARVIAAALTPLRPSAPRTTLVLAFGGSLGLLVGGIIAIARHHRVRTIDDERQLEAWLGVANLGVLPYCDTPFANPAASRRRSARRNRFATAMRHIRTSFEVALRSPRNKCIGVTSASGREGTSLLAFQLALAFAAAGRRTLLIDANTRNPKLSSALATPGVEVKQEGLIQALSDGNVDGVVLPPSGGRLLFMPIGRGHQSTHLSDLVDTPGARALLESLRARFDRIVIDLPAVSALPDACAFGLNLDSYILVIDAGRTRQADAAHAVAELAASAATIAGAVLNTRTR